MYAVSSSGYRAVRDAADVASNETVVDELPESTLLLCTKLEAKHLRNTLLRASDWTQSPDSPLNPSVKAQWAVYRQELRDLPNYPGFPDCAWPQPPQGELNGD